MDISKSSGEYAGSRELQQSMAACLRVLLDEIWGHYRDVMAERERLKNAGVAISQIYKVLDTGRKEASDGRVPADPDGSVRRS